MAKEKTDPYEANEPMLRGLSSHGRLIYFGPEPGISALGRESGAVAESVDKKRVGAVGLSKNKTES